MPTLKEYNTKLVRLRNTRKMTRTMKMVAANKLRKIQGMQKGASDYEIALLSAVSAASRGTALRHPLLTERNPVRNAMVIVISSDRGLCGGFNNNLCRHVSAWLASNSAKYSGLKLAFCGRRGFLPFRSRPHAGRRYAGLAGKPAFADVRRLARELVEFFLSGVYDEIFAAYNSFRSAFSQAPTVSRLLPMDPGVFPPNLNDEDPDRLLFEPDREALVQNFLPQILTLRLYSVLLESAASEHAARMTAMENSTRNVDGLIDRFTLFRNRARQSAITRELIEIIAGAEALA